MDTDMRAKLKTSLLGSIPCICGSEAQVWALYDRASEMNIKAFLYFDADEAEISFPELDLPQAQALADQAGELDLVT